MAKKIPGTYAGSNVDAETGITKISGNAHIERGTNKQGTPYVSLIAFGDEAATLLRGKFFIPKDEKRTNPVLLGKLQSIPTDKDGFYIEDGAVFSIFNEDGSPKAFHLRQIELTFKRIFDKYLAK